MKKLGDLHHASEQFGEKVPDDISKEIDTQESSH
jgi:hypothetical protein